MVVAKPKLEFPDAQELLETVDMDLVANEVWGDGDLKDYDFEDAKQMVWNAAVTWLPRDVVEFDVEAVETKRNLPYIADGDRTHMVKGYLDLVGTMRGEVPALSKWAGRKFLLDWKTSKNALGTDWKNRKEMRG